MLKTNSNLSDGQLQLAPGVEFLWKAGKDLDASLLEQCSILYSNHYGKWGNKAKNPSKLITLSSDRIRQYISSEYSWAALALDNGRVVGYAFADKISVKDCGLITWVTQLVVHSEFRKRGIATRLLLSIWSFSDHFAWGLVTANPYAIRALEKATRRRCNPSYIVESIDPILKVGTKEISYVDEKAADISNSKSRLNTKFFVDLTTLPAMVSSVTSPDVPWMLGDLSDGFEWLAFTFKKQEPMSLSNEDLEVLLADEDESVRRAYSGMSLDNQHIWLKHTKSEVDFLISSLNIAKGAYILDFGCGSGRHSIELGSRGYNVLGIDFLPNLIDQARASADSKGLLNVTFEVADCRTFFDDVMFDHVICLYDVIGSYPNLRDNNAIVRQIFRNLRDEGTFLATVLALTPMVRSVKHIFSSLEQSLDMLLNLEPSNLMQTSGQIFDADHMMIDITRHVIYRKEQFDLPGSELPRELLVRDMRFTQSSIDYLFSSAGLTTDTCYATRLGAWAEPLSEDDTTARELLLIGSKPQSQQQVFDIFNQRHGNITQASFDL